MENTIEVVTREPGKSERNRIKREGYIPGVIYGHNMENISIAVNKNKLVTMLIHGLTETKILTLAVKIGDKEEKLNVVVKEIQKDPVTGLPLSVDFYRIEKGHKMVAEVPVRLVGKSLGQEKGGVLEQHLNMIHVEALPKDLPEYFELDISKLDIGDSLSVSDINISENIKVHEKEGASVVAIVPPTISVEEPAAETEEEEEAVAPEKSE